MKIRGGDCSLIRLYRKLVKYPDGAFPLEESYDYVDVPVCGSQSLYDNGISVCGYKWKKDENNEKFMQSSPSRRLTMLRKFNENVECFTNVNWESQLGDEWKLGDVIYKVGENQSTIIVS